MKFDIQSRLMLLTGSAALAVAAISAQSWFNLKAAIEAMQVVHGNVSIVRASGRADMLHDALNSSVLAARLAAAEQRPADVAAAATEVREAAAEFVKEIEGIASTAPTEAARASATTTLTSARRYAEEGIALTLALQRQARADAEAARFEASFKVLEQQLEETTGILAKGVDQRVEETERTKEAIGEATLLAGLGVLALVVSLGLFTLRSVMRPLRHLVAATHALNSGESDLTRRLPPAIGELGTLSTELNAFFDKLAGLVRDIQRSADEIQAESAEIATGNADLQHRTETSASNLQQTASSVEEINATIQQTAEAARKASAIVETANGAATQGGEAVGRVVHTMEEIREASTRIADIVGVIDGIAFQTNILALNASVEAARAGTQGKGFAVVATEVRALAKRSADAAREIATLIKESGEKVASGTARVRDAGRSMDDIVGSVQQVSQMMGAITAAANEQSIGMEQVTASVSELDRLTQQNAALVEQSAAAAHVLSDRARGLASAVAGFRVHAA